MLPYFIWTILLSSTRRALSGLLDASGKLLYNLAAATGRARAEAHGHNVGIFFEAPCLFLAVLTLGTDLQRQPARRRSASPRSTVRQQESTEAPYVLRQKFSRVKTARRQFIRKTGNGKRRLSGYFVAQRELDGTCTVAFHVQPPDVFLLLF